jgi:hypothetical protein
MRTIAMTLAIFISGYSFAAGPFDNVNGKSLIYGVDDCSSTKLVNKSIRESGINFLDTIPSRIWSCGDPMMDKIFTNGGTLRRHCAEGKKAFCYSNSPSGFPAVCVANPRSVELKKYYGDAGNVTEHRARFDGLYILSKEGSGHDTERSWQMDPNGCDPTSANLDNPSDSIERCMRDFESLLHGGFIYDPKISEDKFCDGGASPSSRGSHLSGIARVHGCLEAYPQLYDVFYRGSTAK